MLDRSLHIANDLGELREGKDALRSFFRLKNLFPFATGPSYLFAELGRLGTINASAPTRAATSPSVKREPETPAGVSTDHFHPRSKAHLFHRKNHDHDCRLSNGKSPQRSKSD